MWLHGGNLGWSQRIKKEVESSLKYYKKSDKNFQTTGRISIKERSYTPSNPNLLRDRTYEIPKKFTIIPKKTIFKPKRSLSYIKKL